MHGLDKLGDLAGAEQFFASLGMAAPGLTGRFVGVTETVGGVLLIAGLATPLVSAALAIDMLVALLTAHIGQGFFADEGASSSRCCSAAPASASASPVPVALASTPRSTCLSASCNECAV